MRAHVSNDAKAMDEVLALLRTLQDAWERAVAQVRSEGSAHHD
jgi:flagellin-specific chaperone FliS